MSNAINILSDVSLAGALSFSQNYTDFPSNPAPRTIVVKDGVPYMYTELVRDSGFFTWQPIGIKQASYLHTQGVSSSTWTVTHNFNSNDFAYFVYDTSHNLVIANIQLVDLNTCKILLTQAMTGTVVLFSLQYLNSTTVETSALNIGGMNITNDNGKLCVNGDDIAFVADVAAEATARAAADAVLETKIDNIVNVVDPSILNSLNEMLSSFQTADGSLASSITALGTSTASAVSSETVRAEAAEAALSTSIAVETARALAAEASLAPQATTYTKTEVDSAIASATPSFSTLTGKPSTLAGYGIADAMTASAIAAAIAVETTRATDAEASLLADIISNISTVQVSSSTSLDDEVTRATAAEALLQSEIDSNTASILAETTRATAAELLLAPLYSPTFTGVVNGITQDMVGLNAVDNTSDLQKPVSTAQAAAIAVETDRALAAEALLAPQATTYTKSEVDAAIADAIAAFAATLYV